MTNIPAILLPMADFSQETWWLTAIKATFIVGFLLTSVIMALWVERRGIGLLQTRPGPNVHGPLGLFQSIADALKLVMKEDFWLKGADKFIYVLSPFLVAFSAFMVYSVIPFGPNVEIFGHSTPLQLTDMNVAVLYILAITALGVYGIVLGGWSSTSTFPLLGSIRSCAQIISYELSMGLSLVTVFLVSKSMSTSEIVDAQTQVWWMFPLMPAFIIYFISMMGEVNRLPFDLPEAEGELLAGHMIEYSSMKFAWFFLAEYINMFNVSAVATTLFLGGWRAPFGLSYIADGYLNTGFWPMLWFIGKVWFFIIMMVWIRATLLRFRYDQFMKFGWKVLIPASLVWLFIVMLSQASAVLWKVDIFTMLNGSTPLRITAYAVIGILALMIISPFISLLFAKNKKNQDKKRKNSSDGDSKVKAYGEYASNGFEIDDDGYEIIPNLVQGFPVPALPGQKLEKSERQKRLEHNQVQQPTENGESND